MPSTLSSLTPVDDAQVVSAAPIDVSALFFNDRFTGNGKTARGLLNKNLSALDFTPAYARANDHQPINERIHHSRPLPGGVDTSDDFYIPLHPILEDLYALPGVQTLTGPLLTSGFVLGSFYSTERNRTYQVTVLPSMQAAHLVKIKHQVAANETNLHLRYRLQVMVAPKDADIPATAPATAAADQVIVHNLFGYDIVSALSDYLTQWLDDGDTVDDVFDMDALNIYLGDLNVHDLIIDQANLWVRGEMISDLLMFAENISNEDGLLTEAGQTVLTRQMTYLESYPIDINYYFQLFTGLSEILEERTLSVISMGNLKMLLNVDLKAYGQAVEHIDFVPAFNQQALDATQAVTGITYSAEQSQIVTSAAPAMMTSSGAGTGKSTAMVGRSYYLRFCGILPQDIQFYTFTVAGKDNILARAPGVQSVTNDSFIQSFYRHNYPQHVNSELDSVINMLNYHLADDESALTLRQLLIEASKPRASVSDRMKLMVHIQYNFVDVIRVLDTIKMVTSDLQRIISYLNLENMAEPDKVAPFVIIDEVQDNSIFEFMFFLRRAALRRQSLAMVGDASQTMYGFRSADPKALNALEASGIFSVYKMTENYRSNQEILAMANDILTNIDANRMSQIQLVSPTSIPDDMTVETFTTTVRLHSWQLGPTRGGGEGVERVSALDQVMQTFDYYGMEFLEEKMAQDESVCIVAPSRFMVRTLEDKLRQVFPDKKIDNITSDRPYSISHLTSFINVGFDELAQVPLDKCLFALYSGLERYVRDSVQKKASSANAQQINREIETLMRPVQSWRTTQGAYAQSLVARGISGELTQDQVIRALGDSLAQFESNFNQERIHYTSMKNRERKAANEAHPADITLSTFHGTKGLEYDHMLLLVNQDDLFKPHGSEDQESLKRLLYVGITRARISEFIMAYRSHNKHDDVISDRYEMVKRKITEAIEQSRALNQAEIDRHLTQLAQLMNKSYEDVADQFGSLSLSELSQKVESYAQIDESDEIDPQALRTQLMHRFADTLGVDRASISDQMANQDMIAVLTSMGQDVSAYDSLMS